MTYVILDTETTGIGPDREPWDVAIIGPDGTERQWYVHPRSFSPRDADPAALDIGRFWGRHPHAVKFGRHGLYNWDLIRLPGVYTYQQVLTDLVAAVPQGATIVGSKPTFDTEMLERGGAAFGLAMPWHHHPTDIQSVMVGFLLGTARGLPDSRRTDDLYRAIGVDPALHEKHTAVGDCRMVRDAMAAMGWR